MALNLSCLLLTRNLHTLFKILVHVTPAIFAREIAFSPVR